MTHSRPHGASMAITFRRSAKQREQASRLRPGGRVNTAKPGKQASRLRRLCSVGVFHRQVCRNSYRRRAFRRRDACSPGLRNVRLSSGSQARRLLSQAAQRSPCLGGSYPRLRSLRSKAPTAVARLRSVAPSYGSVLLFFCLLLVLMSCSYVSFVLLSCSYVFAVGYVEKKL